MLVSVLLITPLTIIDNINPLLQIIEHSFENTTMVATYIQYILTPLCLYIFNYLMIPYLIDFLITFEKRSRKSHDALTKLRK